MNQPLGSCYGKSFFDIPIPGIETEVPRIDPMDELPLPPFPDQPPLPDEFEDPRFNFGEWRGEVNNGDVEMVGPPPGDPPVIEQAPGRFVETFEGCGATFPGGKTFMSAFREDKYAEQRQENVYFPWASKQEWTFASWLLRSRLSMAAIDSLLSLDIVSLLSRAYCATF